MVSEVSNIVYNTLLAHGAIHLPSVGTLHVVRKGATMSGKRRVVAPEYRIEYSSSREAISIVEVIAQCASVSDKSAEDIYMLWLDKVRHDERVEIAGVGVLRNKSFVADEALLSRLNPNKGIILDITRQRRHGRVALYITASIAIIAGIAVYLVLFGNDAPKSTNTAMEHPQESNATTVEHQPNIEPVIADLADANNTINNTDITNDEPINETIESETLDNGPWYERDDIRHYVVVGSYTKRRNADNAMKNITNSHDDVECYIFKRDKMYTLAIYGSADIESCEDFAASHKSDFTQAWVYSLSE